MTSSHMDYTTFLSEYVEAKNTYERTESLDRLRTAIKNYLPNPNRCIANEIEQFKIMVKDTSLSIQLKILNCLIDYVKYTNLDDDSLVKFYRAMHEELFGNILYQIKAYDTGYQLINSIIEKHTSKKYIVNAILNQFAASLECEINSNGDIDKIIPYCVLLEQIILKYGASTLTPKFISLLSSIDYKDNKFKQYIENTIDELKKYRRKQSDEVNESYQELHSSQQTNYTEKSQISLVESEGDIFSMLKNFQYAISHPSNIDSNYDFDHSISVIISILERSCTDEKLLVLCFDTIEKLAYVKLDQKNQFKLFNYLITSIESTSDNPIKSIIANCLSRVICNYNIQVFREFLKLVHEQKLSEFTIQLVVNSLIEFVPQNMFERNKILFEAIEDFAKLTTRNDLFDHINQLYNTIRELIKMTDKSYDITNTQFSPGSTLAKSLSLSDLGDEPTNPTLSQLQRLSNSQSQKSNTQCKVKNPVGSKFIDRKIETTHKDPTLDITDKFRTKRGSRPLLINVIESSTATNNTGMYPLSSLLELKSKFVCMVSQDLFNCMFDIENKHYERMSLEACKFWANYIQQENKCVRNLIFLQENLFHPILVWFYRTLSYRNSIEISLTAIIFIISGISSISTIRNDRRLVQDELLYIIKMIFYILNKKLVDINTILDGGLTRILNTCISIVDKFPSFFTPFYITLSDVSIDVSLSIMDCFENIIFSENSVIGRNEIQYMLDVKSQIISMTRDYKLVEATNKLYKKLSPLPNNTPNNMDNIDYERIPTHLVTDTMSSNDVFSSIYNKQICQYSDNAHYKPPTKNVFVEINNTFNNIQSNYKSLLDEYEKLSISIQNYSVSTVSNTSMLNGSDNRYSNDTESIMATFNLPTLLADSLQLTKSLEHTLRNIRSSHGVSMYDNLQQALQNICTSLNYHPEKTTNCNVRIDSCISITQSVKMIYNNLIGKKPNLSADSVFCTRPSLQNDSLIPGITGPGTFYGEKRQVDISEFVPVGII